MENFLKLAGLVPESITDGPGMRFTVFCQGCIHHCEGCHNPETWDFNGGELFSVTDIFNKICENPLLTGVTFSGGEPFCQAEGFYQLAVLCKQKNLEVAVYTGFTFEYLLENGDDAQKKLLEICDVLVDGKFDINQKSLNLKFYGSKNQRILDAKLSAATKMPILKKDNRWDNGDDLFPPVSINYKIR